MDEELKNGENETNTARRERRRLEQREQGKNIEEKEERRHTRFTTEVRGRGVSLQRVPLLHRFALPGRIIIDDAALAAVAL
jgi:hypothetical protein